MQEDDFEKEPQVLVVLIELVVPLREVSFLKEALDLSSLEISEL